MTRWRGVGPDPAPTGEASRKRQARRAFVGAHPFAGCALALAAVLAGAPSAFAQQVHPGEEQGLGLIGPDIPQILKDARAHPYAVPDPATCGSVTGEIAALDNILGADLDNTLVPKKKESGPDPMAAVRHFLPYGGVIRFLTGAGKKEQRLVNVALAGWERRGFLKAVARSMACPGFEPFPPAIQAAAAAPGENAAEIGPPPAPEVLPAAPPSR